LASKFEFRKGKLDNKNTRFSGFTWGDHPEIKRALEAYKERVFYPDPIRIKVKL
jgi:hypothetical protein